MVFPLPLLGRQWLIRCNCLSMRGKALHNSFIIFQIHSRLLSNFAQGPGAYLQRCQACGLLHRSSHCPFNPTQHSQVPRDQSGAGWRVYAATRRIWRNATQCLCHHLLYRCDRTEVKLFFCLFLSGWSEEILKFDDEPNGWKNLLKWEAISTNYEFCIPFPLIFPPFFPPISAYYTTIPTSFLSQGK